MIRFLILLTTIILSIVTTGCETSKGYKELEYNLEVEGGKIYGTLTLPKGNGTYPVALIHQGSGPTDRDGNNNIIGDNNSLKMLAQGLAEAGIASVRYDKRGIGESMNLVQKEEDLVFEDYISDANLWIAKLRDDNRFDKIFVIGHSEGALIAGQAAANSKVDGFISIAGLGYSAYDTLLRQLSTQPKEITDITTRMLEQLKEGRLIENVPQELYAIFRPSVQPYLISWFKYDPVKVYQNINSPILILQGNNDIQVTIDDAKRLSSVENSKLVIINGMNHVLKDAPRDPEENLKTYSDPKLPINGQLLKEIIDFIRNNK
jgi:pimeloyl-ACP methyl ester carboxylesterase